MANVDSPATDMGEDEKLFADAERLIFRNMKFIIAELVTTPELINTFQALGVFQPDQVAALYGCVRKHPDFSGPCHEVNEYLLDLAVQLDTRQAFDFLRSLEQHQPEIPKLILMGQTVEEISSGPLGGGDAAGSDKPGVDSRSKLEDVVRKYGGRPLEKLSEYLLRKGLITQPEEEKPYKAVESHSITPDGGQYEFVHGLVRLSVPRGAVGAEALKCTVNVSSDKGQKYLLERHSVYVSQRFLFTIQNDLHFQFPVTVTVTVPKIRLDSGKTVRAMVFRSDTPQGVFPDFQDVSDECSPTFSEGAVQFKVTHFSEYAFMILPLAALVGIRVALILATKIVRLDVAAKRKGLKPGDDRILMKMCVVDARDNSARICQDDYELVSRTAPPITMPYNQYVDVKLAKYSGPFPPKASACGEGGYWATTSSDGLSLQRDTPVTFCLLQIPVPAGMTQDLDERRPVLADGFLECTVPPTFPLEHTSGPVSVHFIVATEEEGDERMDASPGKQHASHVK